MNVETDERTPVMSRSGHQTSDRILLWTLNFVAIALVGAFLRYANRGLDLTDEAYYLHSIGNPGG